MATITVNYFSSALMRNATLNVILPFDHQSEAYATDVVLRHDPKAWDTKPYPPRMQPFRVLFLLHGISGNHDDWLLETNIARLASERNLAVVMPSGYNAFYLDHPESHNYYARFVSQEIVEVARRMFPISDRREDTFIGGISMGGYGALRNGLLHCETFGAIISLSCAMIAGNMESIVSNDLFFLSRSFLESTFGNLDQLWGSDKDPSRLAADLVYCDRPRPRIFGACGQQDPLAPANRMLFDRIREIGLDVNYQERPGGHDWPFWNSVLPEALDWLPRA